MDQYRVVVYRSNGRFVRDFSVASKYAAKVKKRSLEAKYDHNYYVEIERQVRG